MRSLRSLMLGCAVVLVMLPSLSAGSVIEPADIIVERVLTMKSELQGSASNFLSRIIGREDEPLFSRPYGIAWDGPDLLVTDTGVGTVTRVGRDGTLKHTPPGVLSQPIAVLPCFEGIAVSDSVMGGVALFDRSLSNHEWLITGMNRPTGLACHDDVLAVVETGAHRVALLLRDGSMNAFGRRGNDRGEFNFPTIVATHEDEILVGDALNFRVQRFDREGNYLGEFGELGDSAGAMPRMKGMAIDGDGRIWMTDGWLDQIAVYASDGTFLMNIGHAGEEAGAFSFPTGIALHSDGRIAIADSFNRRVQILRLDRGGAP